MSYEVTARYAKVGKLIPVVAEAAVLAEMDPLDMLARYTDKSWKLISDSAGVRVPSEESKRLVVAHFKAIEESEERIAKIDTAMLFNRFA